MEPSSPSSASSTRGRFVQTFQPQLPVELLDDIFGLCDPNCYPSIHLASKAFSQIVRPHFFSRVVMHGHPRWNVPGYNHFAGFLHLAPFVRSLEVISLAFYQKIPTEDELQIQADNLELTFQSLPLLRLFAFNLQSFINLEPNSPLDRSPRRRYIVKPRGYYHYVPPILRAALLHPTLETFDVPTLIPNWITHATLPLPPRPSNRPLLIPILDLRSSRGFASTDRPDRFGSNASLAPILQALVALGIHVHEGRVYFNDLSSDLVDLARNPIQGLQTLEILLTDGQDNPNTHLIHFPADTLLLLAASHPQLTTIKTRGIAFSDDRRRTTKELLWSLLSRIPGFECVVDSREEAWTTLDQMSFALRFTTPGEEGRRKLVELELDVQQDAWPYPISLEETLVGIGSHFVDLEVLKLSGKFKRSELGRLQLPSSTSLLFPSLLELTLPILAPPHLLLHRDLILPSSTCQHHPFPFSTSDGLIINSRDQDIADALNFAGGPIALWKQETVPRIASDVVRLGQAFPRLTTVQQDVRLGPKDLSSPSRTAQFKWSIRGDQGWTVWAEPWLGNGAATGVDGVGWCSCGGGGTAGAREWEGEDDGTRLLWWMEGFEKTPLFELEPDFTPAFYLDRFFPSIQRPRRT